MQPEAGEDISEACLVLTCPHCSGLSGSRSPELEAQTPLPEIYSQPYSSKVRLSCAGGTHMFTHMHTITHIHTIELHAKCVHKHAHSIHGTHTILVCMCVQNMLVHVYTCACKHTCTYNHVCACSVQRVCWQRATHVCTHAQRHAHTRTCTCVPT